MEFEKCILIIDQSLSTGVIANVSAVLAMSVGRKMNGLIGDDIIDRDGTLHRGLTQLPIPILGASSVQISEIRQSVVSEVNNDMILFDFNNFAQQARTYEEYTSYLQSGDVGDIVYLGIAIYGDKKRVNKVTKGLTLIGSNN